MTYEQLSRNTTFWRRSTPGIRYCEWRLRHVETARRSLISVIDCTLQWILKHALDRVDLDPAVVLFRLTNRGTNVLSGVADDLSIFSVFTVAPDPNITFTNDCERLNGTEDRNRFLELNRVRLADQMIVQDRALVGQGSEGHRERFDTSFPALTLKPVNRRRPRILPLASSVSHSFHSGREPARGTRS